MRLITLNTWGGRIQAPLLDFIKRNKDIDIFCFQEVNNNASDDIVDPEEDKDLFTHIQNLLPEFTGYFSPQVPGTGHAIFIKKGLGESSVGLLFYFKRKGNSEYARPLPQNFAICTYTKCKYKYI